MLKRLTPPVMPAVTLLDAKTHLRIDHDLEDERIRIYLGAAIEFVEDHTGRALAEASFEQTFNEWPACGYLDLAIAPVRSVDAVAYMDVDGVEQTLSATDEDWYWRATAEGARITFTDTFDPPDLWERLGDVRVRFTAGYNAPRNTAVDTDASLNAPDRAREAVLLLLGDFYENRQDTIMGTSVLQLPRGAQALLDQLRIYR